MFMNMYERPIKDGMYIQYAPLEHTWQVVEDTNNETDKAVPKSLKKMKLGPFRRVVARGEYQGNMTETKVEKIKKSIATLRRNRPEIPSNGKHIYEWWCPRCGYFEAPAMGQDRETTICPTCNALINGHDPEDKMEK